MKHSPFFSYFIQLLSCHNYKIEYLPNRLYDPKSLKYLLSDPLWKKFANPCSAVWSLCHCRMRKLHWVYLFFFLHIFYFLLFSSSIPLGHLLLPLLVLQGSELVVTILYRASVLKLVGGLSCRGRLNIGPLWRNLKTHPCPLVFTYS